MSNQTMSIDGRSSGFNWPVALFLLLIHIGAVVALFNFTWSGLGVALLLWWISGSLGIGMGFHRLLTHRGYKTPKWMEYFLTLCGTLAVEGGSIAWVATHRIHHTYTEKEGDPHSPRDGFFWSHMGWIINGHSMHAQVDAVARHCSDIAKDPFHRFISVYHLLPSFILGGILYYLGGMNFVLWGMFARIVFAWHSTWFVNSAAHVWGYKTFNTRDDSRNLWWVALMSFGEGWHNNHHAHPSSARHGLAWYEMDINWYGIWVLKKLGLAKDIRLTQMPKRKVEPELQEVA